MSILRTIGWLIGIVYSTIPAYWLLVHPQIAWWRRRRARLALVGPFWLMLWLLVGAITWPWRGLVLYETPWAWIPAIVLIAAGLFVYSRARENFSTDQVLGRSELEPERHVQQLNTRGIRARVRHPYYLGHLCELIGWSIGTGLGVMWCLLGFAVVTGLLMIRAEERELAQRFGEDYRAYQRRVPAIFPRRLRGISASTRPS